MYLILNIITISTLICGVTLLSLKNPSNIIVIFGSIMTIIGLLIATISILIYIFSKDAQDVSTENPIPVARVVNNEDLQVDNIKVVVGIAV